MESIEEAIVELELKQFYTFFWWGYLDLNRGPTGYEPAALTTELYPHARKNRKTIFESLSSILCLPLVLYRIFFLSAII